MLHAREGLCCSQKFGTCLLVDLLPRCMRVHAHAEHSPCCLLVAPTSLHQSPPSIPGSAVQRRASRSPTSALSCAPTPKSAPSGSESSPNPHPPPLHQALPHPSGRLRRLLPRRMGHQQRPLHRPVRPSLQAVPLPAAAGPLTRRRRSYRATAVHRVRRAARLRPLLQVKRPRRSHAPCYGPRWMRRGGSSRGARGALSHQGVARSASASLSLRKRP